MVSAATFHAARSLRCGRPLAPGPPLRNGWTGNVKSRRSIDAACRERRGSPSLVRNEGSVFSGRMSISWPKQARESPPQDNGERSWTAKPILSPELLEDIPLEEVYVGVLKRKEDISAAIRSVSAVLPGFHHLKRCSSRRILLARSREPLVTEASRSTEEHALTEESLKSFLRESGFDLSLLEDRLQLLMVPSRRARTKSQAALSSAVWPLNFHPDPNIERLIDGSIFTEGQLGSIERYMNVAVQAARSAAVGDENCNGSAVIVDPEDGRILSIAASKIDEHPMWHAAMLAVDLVARSQGGGAWQLDRGSGESAEDETRDGGNGLVEKESGNQTAWEKRSKRKHNEEAPLVYPAELLAIELPKEDPLKATVVQRGRRNNGPGKTEDRQGSIKESAKCGPYLCTGYWTFLLREPCPLCAMALLHSRVSRIFYGIANPRVGVLGSKTVLHAIPGLNHRYQVWSGILERECRQALREIEDRNKD